MSLKRLVFDNLAIYNWAIDSTAMDSTIIDTAGFRGVRSSNIVPKSKTFGNRQYGSCIVW